MSHDNPTPLRVGATGTLNGWSVRVAGRLVMGMEDGGETYYWSEYYLVDDSGNSATLVFEETEHGGEWKLFRDFTPSHPLTAREAASKRVGDMVNLDGTPTRITLVDQSRVYHIEGSAPEGVEVGDVANYFNADTGSRMLVASWTGDEIEFYEGLDAPADSVADAFKIPRATASWKTKSHEGASPFTGSNPSGGGKFIKIVMTLLGVVSLFGAYSCFSGKRQPSISSFTSGSSGPRPKQVAPALQLPVGAQGSLAQHSYVIDGRALVEMARVVERHDRREYLLRDETNQAALLVNGLSGGSKEWHLFRPVTGPAGLTPHEAANKRKGAPIAIEGRMVKVTDLFQSKAASADGPASDRALPGAIQYGFVASEAGEWLIARWTETQIQFLRGTAIPDTEVIAALGTLPEKAK
jgi:hypothetical protein